MENNITYQKTSESVSSGHPDKLADYIADSVFDYLRTLKKDPQSAVEVAASSDVLMVFGEIDYDVVHNETAETNVDKNERKVSEINPILTKNIRKIVVKAIKELGYNNETYNPEIIINLVVQSSEINNAVEKKTGNDAVEAAAGDQGIVMGFATKETPDYHELHYILPVKIMKELEKDRRNGKIEWLLPDAKAQVTVSYEKTDDGLDKIVNIDNILISQSHLNIVDFETVKTVLEEKVKEIAINYLNSAGIDSKVFDNTEILINPAGAWSDFFGPAADSGLLGRKIVADNYGSAYSVGGGATSGKNSSKVDRSGAYYARNIAKSIVSSGLADKVGVELGFAIGVPTCTSVYINTFGTEKIPLNEIYKKVYDQFGFKVQDMKDLTDRAESFKNVAKYGAYTDSSFPWEQTVML